MDNIRNGSTEEILSKIYRKAVHLKLQNASLTVISAKTNLDKLLKLQLANLYQDHEHVVEVIKTEVPFFINRALSYKWFIKDSIKYVRDIDYFEKYLLPNISSRTRRKLLERLNVHLKNETMCDKYFTTILLSYGIADAISMLPGCSINLITSVLNEWKILLTCKQLLSIYKKSKFLAIEYLNTFTVHFCYKTKGSSKRIGLLKTYNKVFKQLFIDDPISFYKIYKQFCNYYGEEFHLFVVKNEKMKLNKKATEDLIMANPQFITENSEICFELLHLEMLFENLPIHDFIKVCFNCLPSNSEDVEWSKMYLLLRKIKGNDKFNFIKNIYESKYQTEILNNHDFNNSTWTHVMPPNVKEILFKKYSKHVESVMVTAPCSVNEVILLLQNAYHTNKDITYKCTLLDILTKSVSDNGAENITKFIFELCTKYNWEIIRDEVQAEVKTKIINILAKVWTKQLVSVTESNNVIYAKKNRWPGYNGIRPDYIENQLKLFVTNNLPVEAELIRCLFYRQLNYYSHNFINHNNCRKLDIKVFATLLKLYADSLQEMKRGETKELILASLTVFVFAKIWHKVDYFTLCDYPSIVEEIVLDFMGLQRSDSDLLCKWLRKDKIARAAVPNMLFELRWSRCDKVDKVYILEYILNYWPNLLLTLESNTLIYHNPLHVRWDRKPYPNYRNFLNRIMLLHNDSVGKHISDICSDTLDRAFADGCGYAEYIKRILKIQILIQNKQDYFTFYLEYLKKVDSIDRYKMIEFILCTYSESDINNMIKNEVFFETPSHVILKNCSAVLKTGNGYRIVVDAYNDEACDNKIKGSIIAHISWHCVRNIVPQYLHCRTIQHFFKYVDDNCKNSPTRDKIVSLITRITDHSLFTFELQLIDIATSYLIEYRETRMEEKGSVIKYLGLCLHFSHKLYEDTVMKLIHALTECLLHQCDICYDNEDFAVFFIQQIIQYSILFSLAADRNKMCLILNAIKSHWNAGNTANTELFMYISIWLDILTLYLNSEKELKLTRSNVHENLVNVWREFGIKSGPHFEEQSALQAEGYSDMLRDAARELVVFLGSHCIFNIDVKLPNDCREVFVEGLMGSMKEDMEFYFKTLY